MLITKTPVLLLLALAAAAAAPQQAQAAGRTIRVPLARQISQGAGRRGQPVASYYAPVDIGTPAKRFQVAFDIALADLFVPHYNWNPFKTYLHYGTGFQCKLSSTCIKNDRSVELDYMKCKLTGKPYEDVMTFSSAYALTANETGRIATPVTLRQNFLAISDASDARFKSLPIDGVFGLAPSTQSAATINNLLVSLHQHNLIDNLQFSLHLNPVLDSPVGGELVLGGVDTRSYQGQIYWHPLAQLAASRWTINVQQILLGGQPVACSGPGQRCTAQLSTGLNEVYGPREDVQRIYNLLNTSHQSSGLEYVDCRRLASLPSLSFYVDGIPYAMLASNYVRKMDTGLVFKNETCYVAISAHSDASARDWTLGTNFLGAYYTVYDLTYRQVGFAALR